MRKLTVQEGELFVLQTRAAKRTTWAALRIAVDQVHEGLISPQTALTRLQGIDLDGRTVRIGSRRLAEGEPICIDA
jgi:pyruvate,orthophosphate dikinase